MRSKVQKKNLVNPSKLSLQSLTLILVAKQLLRAYLQNCMVDFAHFRQASRYGGVDFTQTNPLLSGHHNSVFSITMATIVVVNEKKYFSHH